MISPSQHVDGDIKNSLCWGYSQLSPAQRTVYLREKLWLQNAYPAFKKYGDRAYDLLGQGQYGFYAYSCYSYGGGNMFF